jgi:CHAT domain-containing protein/tetratricopeptide (TPR) repeat protein
MPHVDTASAQVGPTSPPAADKASAAKRAERKAAILRALETYQPDQIEPWATKGNQEVLGKDQPDTPHPANNLDGIFGDPNGEPFLVRRLAAREQWLGKDHPLTLQSVASLGALYSSLGRYADAEPLLERALEASERVFGKDHLNTLISVESLATLYLRQGRYANAEPLLVRALEASEREFGKEHFNTLTSVNNLAGLYLSEGRYADAEPLFVRALATRKRLLGRDHPDTLTSVNNLAGVYSSEGRYADAKSLLARGVEASERAFGKEHPHTLTAMNNLAGMYSIEGRHADAEQLLARAIASQERVLGKEHPDTIISYSNRATNLLRDPSLAQRAIGPARALVAALRERRGAMSASAFAEAQRAREGKRQADDFALFAEAAWIAVENGTEPRRRVEDEAFTALQDAIAGTTGKAVGQEAVRHAAEGQGAGLGALVRQRQDLAGQWDANADQLATTAAETGPDVVTRRAALAAERRKIEGEMDRIDARLRVEFPDYFALVRPEPLNVASTQKLLGPDEAILLAVQSRLGTHIIAVSKSDIKWSRPAWTSEQVVAAVKRLLWDAGADVGVAPAVSVKWEQEGGPGYPYDRKTAFALYQQIVAPVGHVLAGKHRVFVAAGGIFSSLPFGILVSAQPQGLDGDPQALRKTQWFADDHALVTIPSIQSLQLLRAERKKPTLARPPSAAGVGGYGDPMLGGDALNRGGRSVSTRTVSSVFRPGVSRSGSGIADIAELKSLARLPGTAIELENMRLALGAPASAVHLQQQATETAIRSADFSRTRIIAFATHGVMAGEMKGAAEPGLVFTPPAVASENDDGFLTASEVSGMKLDADWVILSACNTAAGDGSAGAPGLSGLARSFFYAGARNLLVSHWPVRDDVASRITVDVIRRQQSDPTISRAEALQQAMRAIRDDRSHDSANDTWAHPNAWAPFSLIGDGAR